MAQRHLEQKIKDSHFKLINRDEDRYQKTTPGEETASVGSPKGQCSPGEASAIKHEQNKKGKGSDDGSAEGKGEQTTLDKFQERKLPKKKTWNYWSVLEWSKFTAPGGCRLGDKCAYKHSKTFWWKENSASFAFHIPSNERCNYENFSRIQRPNTEWDFIMSRTSPFSRGKTRDLHFDPDWISESAGLWE